MQTFLLASLLLSCILLLHSSYSTVEAIRGALFRSGRSSPTLIGGSGYNSMMDSGSNSFQQFDPNAYRQFLSYYQSRYPSRFNQAMSGYSKFADKRSESSAAAAAAALQSVAYAPPLAVDI